ncbi:MAG: hypothetical protein JXC31_02815, partial [Acholeplasmataceae bacterium]|nr:hypothetical protein [Acholeplasmataceae bacterium]
FIYIGMMGLLSVSFSYFLSSLTEKLFIVNVEIAFLKQLKSGYPLIIASTAIIIWIAFYIPLTGRHPGFYAPWYSYILLTLVFAMGTGLLMVPIYFLLGKKYQLVLISLIFTLISLLIYFLILSGYIATLVIIGVILWLGISAIESLIHKNKKLGKT